MLREFGLNFQNNFGQVSTVILDGGPSIWAIAALSIVALTMIFLKIWVFLISGAWSHVKLSAVLSALQAGETGAALDLCKGRGIRARFAFATLQAKIMLPEDKAQNETARVAKGMLARANSGLRVLELTATIAPLLGLLGTVLGMIAAFQALQESGSRADPAILAGGIWEALLTTAAGMAVAIPATIALTWFESVIDCIRRDLEDIATRIFVMSDIQPNKIKRAK